MPRLAEPHGGLAPGLEIHENGIMMFSSVVDQGLSESGVLSIVGWHGTLKYHGIWVKVLVDTVQYMYGCSNSTERQTVRLAN
jgi:hypothetical protein